MIEFFGSAHFLSFRSEYNILLLTGEAKLFSLCRLNYFHNQTLKGFVEHELRPWTEFVTEAKMSMV